jgi:hypothetical protein
MSHLIYLYEERECFFCNLPIQGEAMENDNQFSHINCYQMAGSNPDDAEEDPIDSEGPDGGDDE